MRRGKNPLAALGALVWATAGIAADIAPDAAAPGGAAIAERREAVLDHVRVLVAGDRGPRVKPRLLPLPPGAVRPAGWLDDWARAAAAGITGHLDERAAVFEHGYKGCHFEARGVKEKGTGWPLEQCAYWLDGLVRLAYILDDARLIAKARERLDLVVDGVNRGGESLVYWQPRAILSAEMDKANGQFNNWAHSHIGRALVAYYQATGERRILDALVRAYREYPLPEFSELFYPVNGMVNVDPMLETYAMSGDERVLANALASIRRPGFQRAVDRWARGQLAHGHTVIFYENIRVPALMYPWTGDRRLLDATLAAVRWSDERHGLAFGLVSGEEYQAGVGSTRNVETCNVAAGPWTFGWLLRVTGEGSWADRMERAFFNAGPAPVSRDFQTLSYYQSPNRLSMAFPGDRPRNPGKALGDSYAFTPIGHPVLCCVGNANRIVPNYVMSMWMATADRGLAATLYGPCRVEARVADGVPVSIDCETGYPFEETIRLTVRASGETEFPLDLRIPGWCAVPVAEIDGRPVALANDGRGFARVTRRWGKEERLILRLPMRVEIATGRETAFPRDKYFGGRRLASVEEVTSPYASVSYGPLLLALPIPDETPERPVAGARYEFGIEPSSAARGARVARRELPGDWSWQLDAPLKVELDAFRLAWQATELQPLPSAPVAGASSERVTLVPYGCTKFRVSMFPVAYRAPGQAPGGRGARIEFRGEGEVDTFREGARLFGDRTYTIAECPADLAGKSFLRNSIERDTFTVTGDGSLIVLTPDPGHPRAATQYRLLESRGFVRGTGAPTFQLFGAEPFDVTRIYRKEVKAGEVYRLAKWTVVVGFESAARVDPAVKPWGANAGERLYNGIVLPEEWPPREIDPGDTAPMSVPYLAHPPGVIPIDVGRQLFVDDFLVETTTLKRVFHVPTKHGGNPVLEPETELEKNAPYNAAAVPKSGGVWWDPREKIFKMWYEAGWIHTICLATSRDGLTWERPSLDVRPGTNQVLPVDLTPDSWTVVPDWDAVDPAPRYTMRMQPPGHTQPGLCMTSPDGIHWVDRAWTGPAGDRSTHFYNPFRKRWVHSIRSGFRGRSRSYWESCEFLSGALWQEGDPAIWVAADRDDAPDPRVGVPAQLYNLDAVAYESLMLGMFEIHRGPSNDECMRVGLPKITELSFAYSRDGFHWHRPDRRAHIPAERRDVWDRGYVQSVGNICTVRGDRLWIYYSGFQGDARRVGANWRENGMYDRGATGVAFLRRDGFVSMDAAGEGGTLTTRPVRFSGKRLFVNARVPDGRLRVEVRDAGGAPIAPFAMESCIPFSGDSTIEEIRWSGAGDLGALAGREVRFRFSLEGGGSLYAFWVSRDASGRSDGYIAGGGPGYTGHVDTVGRAAIRAERALAGGDAR